MGLILVMTACTAPTTKPPDVPSQVPQEVMAENTQVPSAVPVVENTPVAPTATAVMNTEVVVVPTTLPEQVTVAEFTETNACKLITADEASQFLGETIAPQAIDTPGYSFCTFFTPAGKTLLISITSGDQVKKNFLNEIGQYQKGCKVSYSGSTRAPTPFPPEIEALMSKSPLELFNMDLELQEKCGGKIMNVPEFGPNAYILPNVFGIGSIAIISGESYYTFSFGAQNMDMNEMIGTTKDIVRSAMAK